MKTVSRKELNKAAVQGAKITRVTGPAAPDNSGEIKTLRQAMSDFRGILAGMLEDVARLFKEQAGLETRLERHIEYVDGIRMPEPEVPKRILVQRGRGGYIDTVTVGEAVYKYHRNNMGSVTSISLEE